MKGVSESSAAAPIRFGTSGWRGIFGEDFTFPRLRSALHAVGLWLAEQRAEGRRRPKGRGHKVIVAHDTRFLGERMAEMAAAILRTHGAEPILARGAVPTPVAAHAITRRGAAAGVVLTASHNPPEYHGMKVLGHWGGAIGAEQARRIEDLARGAGSDDVPRDPSRDARGVDLKAPYARELLRLLDRVALERSRLRVVYDAMHGTGVGVLDSILSRAGARVSVRRGEADPRFGGCPPDPVPERLRGLAREARQLRGLRLGLATDGDADRYGVVDADGGILSETEAVTLLVDHLARTGRVERGLAISIATGSLVEKVALHHGLRVERHPIGFKHLSLALVSGRVDVAGEESGGFALSRFCCDKELMRRHGRSVCGRTAVPDRPSASEAVERLMAAPPSRVDGCAVRAVSCDDGLHLALDDGFLMLRASGTEPVLRIYAEARGPRLLRRRLAAGAGLLGFRG
jgi:phosphoglucomutase